MDTLFDLNDSQFDENSQEPEPSPSKKRKISEGDRERTEFEFFTVAKHQISQLVKTVNRLADSLGTLFEKQSKKFRQLNVTEIKVSFIKFALFIAANLLHYSRVQLEILSGILKQKFPHILDLLF